MREVIEAVGIMVGVALMAYSAYYVWMRGPQDK
jgi:hypothetical protein